jgi:ribonuclease P protein component
LLLYLYEIEKHHTFNKQQKLKSHKLIEQLFTKGKSFAVFPVKALYQFCELNADESLQAGVAVSKKHFKKAVDRNRIKRLMREAYRLQKLSLQKNLKEKNKQLAVFFIYTGKEKPEFADLMEKLKTILLHLEETVLKS